MVAALVLAAGMSTRFGANKLLQPLNGRAIISTTVANVSASQARPIVVVTGHEHQAVERALDGLPVAFAHNPDYATGEMLSSIQTGLRHLETLPPQPDAALVVLGDQPLVTSEIIDRLVDAFRRGCGDIIAPRFHYDGPRGHPVLIARRLWSEVQSLPPGSLMRDLLRARAADTAHIVVDTDVILRDVDTPAAYWEIGGQKPEVRERMLTSDLPSHASDA